MQRGLDIERKKYVLVRKLSDFPDPVGGLITLVDNTIYEIDGSVNIGVNRIRTGVSNIILGKDKSDDQLISSVTSNAVIDSNNQDLSIKTLTIVASGAGSQCFDITGNGSNQVELAEIIFANSVKVGTISGSLKVVVIRQCLLTNNQDGITLSGNNDSLFFVDNILENLTGSAVGFEVLGAVTYNSIKISRNNFNVGSGITALNLSNEIDFIGGGLISDNTFEGEGTYLSGITVFDSNWRVAPNSNIGIAGRIVIYPYDLIWEGITYSTLSTAMLDIAEDYTFPEYDIIQKEGSAFRAKLFVNCSNEAGSQQLAFQLINNTDGIVLGFGGDAKLDVDTITWQSGNIVRYTFNGTPDLNRALVDDWMTVESAGNISNNGTFRITAVNVGSYYIDVLNPNRNDNTDDEASNSPATAYGGSVQYVTIVTGNVFVVGESAEFGGIDNTKTYRVQGRDVTGAGGNTDALFNKGELLLING